MAYDINERDRSLIVEAGKARIQPISPDELAAWRKAMAPVWQEYEPDIGKSLIDAALQAN
ncbi:MAG: hypothetical protein GTO60_09875 [Gammaproteobacteria bacterium]|nr:hypothetical protein [Gammaproteobacteria bacterium]